MCGILGLLLANKTLSHKEIMAAFMSLKNRGPDNYDECDIIKKRRIIGFEQFWFGFHRLCINDLSQGGDQPFQVGRIILMCNGEIYNHTELKKKFNIKCESNSDCEVIAHMYDRFGIDFTIENLDGVFAFSLYDMDKNLLYVVRDRIGVRPIFYSMDINFNFTFASEAKALELLNCKNITQLAGGNYIKINITHKLVNVKNYWTLPSKPSENFRATLHINIRELLQNAVKKRLISDRPIGCLLSGGLDSSVIASILAKNGIKSTFSIGFKDSIDLKYARIVANYLDTNHHEIILSYEEALEAIPEVIYAIESYDITTVRASTPMYLLCKHIKNNYKETVIFSGEGSDELMGGYLYFHKAPTGDAMFKESKRLVEELPYYDVLRADRSTSSNGLELRVPFLDKEFLEFCMSIEGKYRKPLDNMEKYYLRKAFEGDLPKSVLWRLKDGMSDGVGGKEKPWYKYIQELAEKKVSDDELEKYKDILPKPVTKEGIYYYKIYKERFPNVTKLTHYWMPKWVEDCDDPSGRVVEIN